MPRRGSREPDGPNARQMRPRRPLAASPPANHAAAAAAPQTVRGSRPRAVSTPLPLTHCSCARAGARQLLGRWQGYSGVNVGVGGWVLPACVAARLPAAGPPAGRRAGCWLLAQTVTLSGCHHHPGNPVQKLSASECYLAALPPSFPLSCCMRGRNARGSAAARRGSCFAPSSEQTGSRTRGRSSSHTYCSCHPQPVVYPHPSQPLFSHIEAV